jgi:hypothetical protein
MLAPGKPRDPAVYHLRGVLRSGSDGSLRVRTIVPGHYDTRARHIHFMAHADGYEPFATQSYFAGDPRLKTDVIARPRNVVRNGKFRLLLRRARPNPPEAVARFDGYEGEWQTPDGMRSTVVRAGDALFVQLPGFPRMELRFDAPDRFRVVELDTQGRAERGPDGKLVAFSVQAFGDRAPTRIVRAP